MSSRAGEALLQLRPSPTCLGLLQACGGEVCLWLGGNTPLEYPLYDRCCVGREGVVGMLEFLQPSSPHCFLVVVYVVNAPNVRGDEAHLVSFWQGALTQLWICFGFG